MSFKSFKVFDLKKTKKTSNSLNDIHNRHKEVKETAERIEENDFLFKKFPLKSQCPQFTKKTLFCKLCTIFHGKRAIDNKG